MSTISKKAIVSQVADKTGLTAVDTRAVVQGFLDQVIEHLAMGNRIEFREFGVFETRRRRGRTARNPKTGEAVEVRSKTVVVFKPGREMRLDVDGRNGSTRAVAARPQAQPSPVHAGMSADW